MACDGNLDIMSSSTKYRVARHFDGHGHPKADWNDHIQQDLQLAILERQIVSTLEIDCLGYSSK